MWCYHHDTEFSFWINQSARGLTDYRKGCKLTCVTCVIHVSAPSPPRPKKLLISLSGAGSVPSSLRDLSSFLRRHPPLCSFLGFSCSNGLHSDLQTFFYVFICFLTFPSSSRLLTVLKGGALEGVSKIHGEKPMELSPSPWSSPPVSSRNRGTQMSETDIKVTLERSTQEFPDYYIWLLKMLMTMMVMVVNVNYLIVP